MSLIQIENLTFSYPGSYDNIFEHVSFQIDTDWKLGFVGRNGRGKTTFLNLLQGKYEYSGTIASSVQFDYFPREVEDESRWTGEILQEICPEAQEWELVRELSYLSVPEDVLWRPYQTLSKGEQTKAQLAACFLREGNFLLIDEPTNHLDMEGRQMAAAYLKKKKGFILVSHDRRFLDGCVDHILSLNRADIEVQSGNFSSWMENFNRQQEFERLKKERLQKDVRRLEKSAKRTGGWSDQVEKTKKGTRNSGLRPDRGFIGHKSAKMMKRAKVIEARQHQAIEEKSGLLKNMETAESLKLSPMTYHTDRLASFLEVAVRYGEKEICGPLSFEVRRGERIALEGGNGSGKSSLLKIMMEESYGKDMQGRQHLQSSESPAGSMAVCSGGTQAWQCRRNRINHTGTITVGSGLVISYVPQDTSHLKGSLSDFAEKAGIEESLFKTVLRKMDFARVQFEKDMADFSGGQKKKALLARSLCEQAHLYVWDEPLNFVDVYSRMQIEELIREFSPAMIFVEHDEAFRDMVATRVINVSSHP